jgi:hypothetical protein
VADSVPDDCYQNLTDFDGATVYHTRGWHRLLARSMGWRVRAVTIRDVQGELVWWLPFVRKWRLGAGRINVCLPLSPQIGPAMLRGRSAFRLPSLAARVWPLEIHEQVEMPDARHCVTHYVTRLDLARYATLDAMRRSFHTTSVNQMIKKAEKSGLRILKGSTEEHFTAFYELQVETRRRQGSPAYPSRFFCMMAEELVVDDVVHLYLVFQDRRPVAGVLFLYDLQGATYAYGASVNEREIWRLGANQLAMWAAIREAHERGLPQVSFGTTPYAQRELREYKERWGAESEELAYTVDDGKEGQLEVKRAGLLFQLASGALTRMPGSLFRWVSRPLTRVVT